MVLADTGYWLALANRSDRWHEVAVAVTRRLDESLVVTWPVLTETCHLMLSRLGTLAELRFVEQISTHVDIYEMAKERIDDVRALMERYSNLPMDLADASLVVAATDLGEGRILTTDQRDFNAYRWKDTEPFTNLLVLSGS
ncbi:MAG: PIN domain-containing protein [Pseudomonadales bacterium]|nr:PIN domain-containing protein [Pseudomonadales bacterium]